MEHVSTVCVLINAQATATFTPYFLKYTHTHTHTHTAYHFHLFVLCDSQPVMSIHRIMHWARRIEQEIDRVFQHITGAQQLKGVSVLLSFYSIQISLMVVLHKLNKECTRHRRQCAE